MSAPQPRARAARALLVVCAVVAVAHLVALLVRAGAGTAGGPGAVADTAVHLTKPALMPLLAGYLLVRGGPRCPRPGCCSAAAATPSSNSTATPPSWWAWAPSPPDTSAI